MALHAEVCVGVQISFYVFANKKLKNQHDPKREKRKKKKNVQAI
jgi:hypothetical protein